jgi:hypothetical protein
MSRLEIMMIWCLRAAVLVTGAIFVSVGEWVMGGFCVIAVVVAVTPIVVVRTPKLTWPFELELVLLGILLTHLTVGCLFQLHTHVVWLHLGNAVVIGFIAFTAVCAAHIMRRGCSHPVLDGLAILFVALSLGALWLIAEFVFDQLCGHHGHGSTLSAVADAVWALILAGGVGLIAALLGPIYIHCSRRCRQRIARIAAHLDERAALAAGCDIGVRPPDGLPWWTSR